jgi:glycosyltransferase involved in cell wall biosynthesis
MVERSSIAFSDHVVIANPIWRERLASRSAKPEKVTAIGNHPDPELFYTRPKDRCDGKFVLCYPGTLNWHQGLDIAIEAFSKVAQEIPEAEFHINGEGSDKEHLVKMVHEMNLEDRVMFDGFLPTAEIARVMSNADLAVVPKRSKSVFGTEAASTKILEFMTVGVPVVISRTKIDSFYHTDATVKFYDGDDPNELAKAIIGLYKNPALRERMAANALVYARENGWNRKQQHYLAIVDRLATHEPMDPPTKVEEPKHLAETIR